MEGKKDRKNVISGTKKCVPCPFEGVALFGNRIPGVKDVKNVPTWQACQKLCQDKSKCFGFSWATEAHPTVPKICRLKNEKYLDRMATNNDASTFISGPVRCPTEPEKPEESKLLLL